MILNITIKSKQVTPAPADHDRAAGKAVRLVATSDHNDEPTQGSDKEVPLKAAADYPRR